MTMTLTNRRVMAVQEIEAKRGEPTRMRKGICVSTTTKSSCSDTGMRHYICLLCGFSNYKKIYVTAKTVRSNLGQEELKIQRIGHSATKQYDLVQIGYLSRIPLHIQYKPESMSAGHGRHGNGSLSYKRGCRCDSDFSGWLREIREIST